MRFAQNHKQLVLENVRYQIQDSAFGRENCHTWQALFVYSCKLQRTDNYGKTPNKRTGIAFVFLQSADRMLLIKDKFLRGNAKYFLFLRLVFLEISNKTPLTHGYGI